MTAYRKHLQQQHKASWGQHDHLQLWFNHMTTNLELAMGKYFVIPGSNPVERLEVEPPNRLDHMPAPGESGVEFLAALEAELHAEATSVSGLTTPLVGGEQ